MHWFCLILFFTTLTLYLGSIFVLIIVSDQRNLYKNTYIYLYYCAIKKAINLLQNYWIISLSFVIYSVCLATVLLYQIFSKSLICHCTGSSLQSLTSSKVCVTDLVSRNLDHPHPITCSLMLLSNVHSQYSIQVQSFLSRINRKTLWNLISQETVLGLCILYCY